MSASSRLVRVALALLAGLALLLPGAGTAGAAATGLQIHHLLPDDGAVLATAPDHVEIMFDQDLVPGGVDVAIAPDDTGLLVALPRQPVIDGPVVVAPLPALAPGHYTVGVQVVDRAGQVQARDVRLHGRPGGDPHRHVAVGRPGVARPRRGHRPAAARRAAGTAAAHPALIQGVQAGN